VLWRAAATTLALLVGIQVASAQKTPPDTPAQAKAQAEARAKAQASAKPAEKPPAKPPEKPPGTAEAPAKPPTAPAAKTTAPAADKLEPVEVGGAELMTRDGVPLTATFFPGDADKNTVPVLLLHSHKGSRTDFSALAPYLASKGYAVLVPDLRGHGQSKTQYIVSSGRRQEVELDAAKLRSADYGKIAQYDMAALRRFLIRKNNEQQLNFNKLVIVGSEMGASVALDWAAYDWSLPSYPGVKQSCDVKALVLLSPTWSHTGLQTAQSLRHPAIQLRLGILIAVGTGDSKANDEARRLHAKLKLSREDVSSLPPEEQKMRSTLWLAPLDTKLQGSKMLNVRALQLPARIASFIDIRVAKDANPDSVWVEHATPN
jgi:pimeloyl-ACP methyl ester carboxylesterase